MKRLMLVLVVFLSPFYTKAQWQQTNGPYCGKIQCIAANGSYVFAGTHDNAIYRSENYGSNWNMSNNGITPYNGMDITTIVIKGSTIYAGQWSTNGGVLYSNDNGDSWYSVGHLGLSERCVCSIAYNDSSLFAGTLHGLFRKTNNGSWVHLNNGITDITIRSIVIKDSLIFVGTGIGMYISTDNGDSWAQINNGLTTTEVNAIATKGDSIYVGTIYGAYISTDNGNNWQAINTGLQGYWVSSLIVIDSVVFAGTFNGIYRTLKNSINWEQKNNGFQTQTYITSIGVNGSRIYACASGIGMYYSDDYGENWIPINNGLTDYYSLHSMLVWNNYIFAGSSYGTIFMTNNNGNNWNDVSSGLPDDQILSLSILGNKLYAGTNSNGIWSRNIDEMNNICENINYEKNFLAYPNPANDKLNIDIEEKATLEIVNVQGQIVDRKSLTENLHIIDISNLVSGVYTLRIKTSNGIAVRKLIKQ